MDRIAIEMTVDRRLEGDWIKQLEALPVLLTYEHLSALLDRSTGALRHAVSRPKSPIDLLLRDARVTVGRRAYFKRSSLARMLAIAESGQTASQESGGE